MVHLHIPINLRPRRRVRRSGPQSRRRRPHGSYVMNLLGHSASNLTSSYPSRESLFLPDVEMQQRFPELFLPPENAVQHFAAGAHRGDWDEFARAISPPPPDYDLPLTGDLTFRGPLARSPEANFNQWFRSGYTQTLGPIRPHPQNYPWRPAAGGSSR